MIDDTSLAAQALTPHEYATIEALADAVIPGTPDDPGAVQAGAAIYIDRALAGAYEHLLPLYRRGIRQLDAHSHEQHACDFRALELDSAIALLQSLSAVFFGAEDARVAPELALFAEQARMHVMEGLLGDPSYGGNHDLIGWRLVGFPGAQWGYTSEQRQYGFDPSTIEPQSLAQLARRRAEEGGA